MTIPQAAARALLASRPVGVIGAGSMAVAHLQALAELGVPAHCFSPSGRGAALADQFGARGASTLDELLQQVSVVDICTPTDTHRPLAEAAFRVGRDVLCEKPLARTLDDARAIVGAAAAAGRDLEVAHVVRYFPAYALAAQLVREGGLGTVTQLRLRRTSAAPRASWFFDEARSGGVLMDQLIHDFDFARWVAGPVDTVTAHVQRHARPAPLIRATVTMQHRSGARTEIHGGWLQQGEPFRTELQVSGSGGTVTHSHGEGTLRLMPSPAQPGFDTAHELPVGNPYAIQLADLLYALAGGTAGRVTVPDALAALELSVAAIESAATGLAIAPESDAWS